jgi:transposase InsO family protein
MSERRACRLIQADRKTVRYRSRRSRDDALRSRLRELAAGQRRFGYRRLHILLRAEGQVLNRKKTQRLYREEGLTVRRRKSRKRARGIRAPILIEARPNARWSVDFVHDQLSNGRRLRILNVIDDVTKECPAAIADTSISGPEGGARARRYHRPARQTRSDHLRPWNRVYLQRDARLGSKQSDRLAFHCAGKTNAERDLRSIQRPHA